MPRKRRIATMMILSMIWLSCAGWAAAGELTELIRRTTDQVLSILENPQLQEAERQQRLHQLAGEVFNWQEMARRALAVHWRDRTPEQQQEFVQLFRDLVENVYINRLQQAASERRDIQYVGEQVEGSRAAVRTKVITARNQEVPIEYRLSKVGDQWKIYDVLVEGVSLVNNYRSQFNRIIATSSYNDLVDRMKARQTDDLSGGPERKVQ